MNKNKLIKGITINDIYDFVDNGDPEDTPEGIALYFVLMEKVRSLDLRAADYGTKASVLNHLIKAEGLTRHLAEKVYYDALEYYYSSTRLSKQAQRNLDADKIDRLVAITMPFINEAKDAKIVADMIEKAHKIRQADKDEVAFIPEEWLKETWTLYTTDMIEAGLEPINSDLLIKQIDNYPEVTNVEKAQVKKEAGLLTLEIFPDDKTNPRKER
ncbi:hypothetical protein [Polaribacter atrinae]|uniref:hypothetical protein n=1 Tax=Polaribacter atrinae TaxID=1333662 RepID=UPI0030F90C26